MKAYDLIILGGGGASALARRAGKAGLKTALLDPGPLGGTCPNRGCIPSKLLLQHATLAQSIRRAKRFHIAASLGRIDTRAILARMRATIGGTHDAIRRSLGRGVRHLPHAGEFEDARTIRAGGERLTAGRIVIATGTRPARPRGIDAPYVVSDDLFLLDQAPRSLILVGGGFIACEFAHFFAGVGTRVTVLERGPELLAHEDADVRRAFAKAFAPRIDLRTERAVERVSFARGRFRVELSGGGRGRIPAKNGRRGARPSRAHARGLETVTADALVYAIGRVPNSDTLRLDRAGVATDERGYVRVNGYLETSVPGIWACGDANGRHLFTHAATAQVEYLGDRLVDRHPRLPLDHGPMPHAVFTDPEIGSVGETEDQLLARGARYVKSVVGYADVPKGTALQEEHGLAKLLASPRGEILGFHVVGPEASILLHQVVPVMRWRNHVSSLTGAVTVHPSLNELVAAAAWDLLDRLPRSARRGPT
ncbi:MAG: dihydrolipoyl dehydrogenase family protein [Planctomycetaceae bacterium]